MVTAILPSLTDESTAPPATNPRGIRKARRSNHVSITSSVDSEVTITPELFREQSSEVGLGPSHAGNGKTKRKDKASALAGYVGLFTGCGALVALGLFLPLPARFGQKEGVTLGQAVSYSFYVVGAVSFVVALFVFFGLRNLKGEEGKGWRLLLGLKKSRQDGNGALDIAQPKHVR